MVILQVTQLCEVLPEMVSMNMQNGFFKHRNSNKIIIKVSIVIMICCINSQTSFISLVTIMAFMVRTGLKIYYSLQNDFWISLCSTYVFCVTICFIANYVEAFNRGLLQKSFYVMF